MLLQGMKKSQAQRPKRNYPKRIQKRISNYVDVVENFSKRNECCSCKRIKEQVPKKTNAIAHHQKE
jgi:hypothetical protein